MALGAGILAIGIIIGQVVTPNIEAQSSGVFGEVVCTGLTVVNHAGEPMIELISAEDTNMIRLVDKAGTPGIGISVNDDGNSMMIMNKRNRGIGIWLVSEIEKDNQILLFEPDKESNNKQIALRSHDGHSLITLGRTGRADDTGITLFSSKKVMNTLKVHDAGVGAAIYIVNETGNIEWGGWSAPEQEE